MEVPAYLRIKREPENGPISLTVEDAKVRKQREMWGELQQPRVSPEAHLNTVPGTIRRYLNNHVVGVSEGHVIILRLVGVGYRATVEPIATTKDPEYEGQQFVNLKVGYSHPIELGVPKGVKASTPQPTRILLEGADRQVLGQFAAKIRQWRVPEPYKGKGIFVNDETIKLKNKKIK